jgi:hypothetical protein
MKGSPGMAGDRYSLSFPVLVDLVASTLPGKEEICSLQSPDHFVSGHPGQPSHGSNSHFQRGKADGLDLGNFLTALKTILYMEMNGIFDVP